MTAIHSVLAATDFSPDALHAGGRAAMLATEHGASLDLLHVMEPDGETAIRQLLASDRGLRARIEEQTGMLLTAQAQELTRQYGIPVRQQLRRGALLQEAATAASEAGLVVVGARGTPTLRRMALGTTAERLMRVARQPVLVVRQPPAAPYARVLVLTDFSASADAALRAAMAVAPAAAIHLMHVFSLDFEGRLRLAGVREDQVDAYRNQVLQDASGKLQESLGGPGGHRVHVSVVGGDVRAQALQAIDELGADLVAVGKQGQSALGDLFLGSTTACLIAQASCDVLGVPAGSAAA